MASTINIAANSDDWRGVALSNFCLSPFVLDGVLLASVEGFIQGIKFPPGDPQRDLAFVASGFAAKEFSARASGESIWWRDERHGYASSGHLALIERAIRARIAQNSGLQATLRSTGSATIVHETGMPESPTTSLKTADFCRILSAARDELFPAA
jgi:predicted NAD-dependent protein-ADP-ribosyltransferase YbiA (DUF1768 family)